MNDGVGRLLRWRDDRLGVPPTVARLGVALLDVVPGSTTVRLDLGPEVQPRGGRPGGAVAALLADVGLTTSVVATLPAPQTVTTIGMTVDHLAPTAAGGTLTCVCRAQPYAGGGPQHCAGEVRDGDRLVAEVSGWFLPSGVPGELGGTDRPPELPARDLDDLLRLTVASTDDGALVLHLHPRPSLTNMAGTLHGGVGALACSYAAQVLLGEGARLLTSSYSYLRPTPPGEQVELRASLVRRGRRTATVAVELGPAGGRTALRATVDAAVGAALD